jgi:tetratricopeptide (TPR) repeat protein
MIVRNEEGRVGRALQSVRDHVDTWLIVDTGSTDGTIREIAASTSGWPGVLENRPWINFGVNRTQLIEMARSLGIADWLLTIDADHVVEQAAQLRNRVDNAKMDGVDALFLPFTRIPKLWTIRLIRANLPWRYVGATREALICEAPFTADKVNSPKLKHFADGSSRANKYQRDIELLRAELEIAPENARSWFCLGESYRGLNQHELAAIAYTNCAVKSESSEERYWAITMSGEMFVAQGKTNEGLARFLMANQERPMRREALLMACQILNQSGRHQEVLTLLADGPIARPIPNEDVAAIIPDAYGPAMARERKIAKEGLRRRRR